jgi:ubiquitin carboxyl-terminal hydrolase 25/28
LAELFNNLEYSENPAVTPTLELAKLALVTSRDEEEDEVDKGGTDSSNDTDATLVEDSPSRPSAETSSPPPAPGKSVLGKRGRELDRKGNEMGVESPISQSPVDKDGFVMISREDTSPSADQPGNPEPEASSSKAQIKEPEESDANVPKATPRRRVEPSDSTMMFGETTCSAMPLRELIILKENNTMLLNVWITACFK